ncbi:MAG TPA: LPXTG cell wall anchor domain-containing protein [Steroidobacteraceae bacterium]|nr:LPXTG cell wall anchor domain-containing protein [Steroidobacteraceae bacterium]
MNVLRFGASCAVLLMLASEAGAQQPAACQTVQFSAEVLARFPRIRDACLDVISRDGVQYAVVKVYLVRTSSSGVTVRVNLPDGTRSEPRFIKTDPKFRVLVDKQPTRVQDLAVGQELSTYIKVTDPMIALEPAEATEPVALTPLADTPPPAPEGAPLPVTGSLMPTLGLAGAILLCLALALRVFRRRTRH